MRLKLKTLINTIKHLKEYIFPVSKLTSKFKKISTIEQLKTFIHERSAHVTQTTLFGYVKTRMGLKYTMMFENKSFLDSLEIAKWNIYAVALADCTFYTFSYLIDKKNLKEINAETIFIEILNEEKSNGLTTEIYDKAILNFRQRLKNIHWKKFYQENPFKLSCDALYHWSPIADELKELDKEIVLNSIKYKWNLVENEFKELTSSFKPN